jgi:hypothetical protein
METPEQSHLNAAKRILRYIKGMINEGMFYTSIRTFNLVGYLDSDWGGDLDGQKSTTGIVFFYGRYIFHMVIQEAIDSNIIKLSMLLPTQLYAI